MSWRDFWNGQHAIYVNARHRLLHYDRIAKDIAALVEKPQSAVLDHGCGEASAAHSLAHRVGLLYLYDQAPNVQASLRAQFANTGNIRVLSTDALDILSDESLDLIIVNSLLQYLSHAEFEALLDFWHGKLKPGGKLVLADLIPPGVGPVTDVLALMKFGWQGGFMFAAMGGLVATFFSKYRKLRGQIGLTHYTEEDVMTLTAAHGFKARRQARNIGHNQARMCFMAHRA